VRNETGWCRMSTIGKRRKKDAVIYLRQFSETLIEWLRKGRKTEDGRFLGQGQTRALSRTKKHQMQPILARRHVYEAGKINANLGSHFCVCSLASSTKFKKAFLRNSVSVFCTKFWEEFGVWAVPCSVPLQLILGFIYKLKKNALQGDNIGPSAS
jgi:hypothetical protein